MALGLSNTSCIVISGCLSFKIACASWYLVFGALVELIIAMNQLSDCWLGYMEALNDNSFLVGC